VLDVVVETVVIVLEKSSLELLLASLIEPPLNSDDKVVVASTILTQI
jgi:hypothetical protein